MASFRKRNGKWEVQVRRHGFPSKTRSFLSKADATEWATEIERRHDRQELGPDRRALKSVTLADLVERYRDEVVPHKRGAAVETILLNRFLRYPICKKPLSDLTTADFANYRDQRLKEMPRRRTKPITTKSLKRELSPLSHMFRHAAIEWEIPVSNPLDGLKLRSIDNKRERRLLAGELERLLEATKKARNKLVAPVILFALETAMRRGEILSIQFRHIDIERSTLTIPTTKTGYSRVIPLTDRAVAILKALRPKNAKPTDRPFPMTPIALRLQWDRLVRRAGIDDLNFHDLRHEAISRLFELGLTVPEVASISGHRTLTQLMRYSHASHEAVRAKLSTKRRSDDDVPAVTAPMPQKVISHEANELA